MTEERMIRITKEGLNFINNLIESNQCSVGQELFSPEGFVWIYVFDRLEPAPPRGWNPLCFEQYSDADSDYCDGKHKTNWLGRVLKELCENCQKCPRLKR